MLRQRLSWRLLLALALLLSLGACNVEETIAVRADGSGTYRAKVSVKKALAEVLDKVKQEAPGHGLRVLEEGQGGDERFVVVGRDFSNVSELSDKDSSYSLVARQEGLFSKTYVFEAVIREDVAASGFKRVLRIHMPGRVDEASVGQPSSHEVEWDCSHPGNLHVVASGFSMSGPTALWTSLDRWLVKDSIVFSHQGELSIIAADGSGARTLGPQGVGYLSAAPGDVIAYDRFFPSREQSQDLNVYLMESIGATPRKLTGDNQSILPMLSPDGKRIVYQKFEWSGRKWYEGKGKGLWLYDVATGSQHQLVGETGDAPTPHGSWKIDSRVAWAPDSTRLIFSRWYDHGSWKDYLAEVPAGPTRPIDSPMGANLFALLKDRKALLFENVTSYNTQSSTLIEQDTTTPARRELAKAAGRIRAGRVSPDGSQIAYVVVSGGQGDLWTLETSGGTPRKVSSEPIAKLVPDLAWALNGKSLAFVTGEQPHYAVSKLDLATGQRTQLADEAFAPRWIATPRFAVLPPGAVKVVVLVLLALVAAGVVFLSWRLSRVALKALSRKRGVSPPSPAAAFCPGCGERLQESGRFCTGCGASLA
jgi:Tol biopolymer transport system component